MPTAKVRIPDGRTVTLQVPEGTTEEQIRSFVGQQIEAGAFSDPAADVEPGPQDLERKPFSIPRIKDAGPLKPGMVVDTGDGPALYRGDGNFDILTQSEAQNILASREQKSLSEMVKDKDIVERGTVLPLGKNRQGETVLALPEIVNQPTEAAMMAGAAAKGGQVTPLDALEFAATFTPGTMGAKVQPRTARGQGASQVIEAGKQMDVPVMTTDVLPPESFVGGMARKTGEMIPIAGTSGPRGAQQQARKAAIDSFSRDYRFNEKDIINSLKSKSQQARKAAGKVIENTKGKLSAIDNIDMRRVNSAIDDVIAKVTKEGQIKDPVALERLKKIKTDLNSGPQSFDLLRENRTTIRETLEALDAAGRSQLQSPSKAAFSKIYSAITDTLDDAVRNNLGDQDFRKYKKADAIYAQEAQLLQKSRLKTVLDKGDITPEIVNNLIFSQKPSEVKTLYSKLTENGRKNVRAAIVGRMIAKSSTDEGINPNKFLSEMRKLKDNTGVFFRGDEGRKIEGLRVLLEATTQAQTAAAITPTGQSLAPLAALIAGDFLGYLTSGTIAGSAGLAARAYESPPVRNFLLALAKTGGDKAKVAKIVDTLGRRSVDALRRISPSMAMEEENE